MLSLTESKMKRLILLVVFLLVSTTFDASAFSNQDTKRMRVLVTGAAGKTGRLVLKKLEEDSRFDPKGLVRSESSARSLLEDKDIHCPLEHMVISDITSPNFLTDGGLPSGLQDMDAMVICTSSVPRISRLSLLGAVVKAPLNMIRRKPAVDFRKLQFKWKHGGTPEQVDYHGQVAQIELAKQLGMKKVVLISSLGGTNPDNFLNTVGKRKDGSGDGDILLWKRKAEKYLAESGLEYTILHPGGLIDTPGGQEDYILDVDDKIYDKYNQTRISREDVASLCVASLTSKQNASFDCITVPRVVEDPLFSEKMESLTETGEYSPGLKAAEKALQEFLERSVTASYALQ